MSDLRAAHAASHMLAVPHFNSVFNYLGRADVTDILMAMIVRTARPLASVETAFAPTPSGSPRPGSSVGSTTNTGLWRSNTIGSKFTS